MPSALGFLVNSVNVALSLRQLRLAAVSAMLLSAPPLAAATCGGELRPVRPPVVLPAVGSQGVTYDESDGSLWITSAISYSVLHLDQRLQVVGEIQLPFPPRKINFVTGIAWYQAHDTLLIAQPELNEIWEFQKDGTATGTVIPLSEIPKPVNSLHLPFVKGIAFDPRGDGGKGSLWLVESVMTAVYEITLGGQVLSSFCHPQDPDGCPGQGVTASGNAVGLLYKGGALEGLELTGGGSRRDRLLRVGLDGSETGVEFSLAGVGGVPGGLTRGRILDPAAGKPRDVLFVTVESSAELHILEVVEPKLLPIRDLNCQSSGSEVSLRWVGFDFYDRIEVLRDGSLLASLAGSAETFTDPSAPDGVLKYEVVASRGDCANSLRCTAVVGAGQVLASVPLDAYFVTDMTEDGSEKLWIVDIKNAILVYDKDLNPIGSLPSPFQDIGDMTTAIAYNPDDETFFVYNAKTNLVAEMDPSGALARDPFPSGVPSGEEVPALVVSMLFDPDGAAGVGSLWYLDLTSGTLQERTRAGDLVHLCSHPDHTAEPPPALSELSSFAGGMTTVPGRGFSLLDLAGGRIRDNRVTRIFRIDARTCQPTNEVIPVDGIARLRTPIHLGIHGTMHRGKPVVYALVPDAPSPHLVEIDTRLPPVPRLLDLSCLQPSDARVVVLRFTNPGGLDAVEVLRDGEPVAVIDGGAAEFEDVGVPEGLRTYSVRGRKAAASGDDTECALRVGPGSLRRREFAFPASFPHQVALDPVTGGYVAASIDNNVSDELFRYDRDLRFVGTISSPFQLPQQVAALAVRNAAGVSEIYCLGWYPGSVPDPDKGFPLHVIDGSGVLLRRLTLKTPQPSVGFVVFPSGLAWDSATDTFWLLERNSATVMSFSPDGTTLSTFPHPAPPFQDGVYNYGLAVAGERNTVYLSSSGTLDSRITRVVEVTRYGTLTGVEIPVGSPGYNSVLGFALDAEGTSLSVAAQSDYFEDLVLYRAFDSLPPVKDLTCVREGGSAVLSWVNGEAYDSVVIYQDGIERTALSGSSATWRDTEPNQGPGFYRVVGRKGGLSSAGVVCGPVHSRPFLRGDAEENGAINISDAISILSFLFLGGEEPACLKTADSDDSGAINITDGIALLSYLFLSGPPPPWPFPDPGLDPTEDALPCWP